MVLKHFLGRLDILSPKRIREMGIISIILIVLLSIGLLIYIQNITDRDLKENLFLQQKERQIASTHDISTHVGSDIDLVLGMLDGLANSIDLQQGFNGENAKKMVGEKYTQFKNVIEGLFVLDKNNIVTISYSNSSSPVIGADYSFRGWVVDTRLTLRPVFYDGFERQDIYTIFISYPIVNRETGQYMGLIAASIPSVPFFSRYGHLENIDTQFLVAYNRYGTMLANGLSGTFVGENFFGDYTQQFIHHNPILNNLTRNLLLGDSASAVYDYGRGQRLTTGYPIFVNNKPTYFIQVVTPLTAVTSQASGLLSTENTKMFLLLGCILAAISVLTIVLIKWNSSLNAEVNRRTKELDESNKQLALANKQLTVSDKMQKEFINIAAHELKTPIQPITALSEILQNSIKREADRDTHGGDDARAREARQQQYEILGIIIRNAKRLTRLSENILDVAKIESQSWVVRKERVNLNELISETVEDFRNQISKENKNIKLEFTSNYRDDVFVEADKDRIGQVISNLLSNAIKFAKTGTITIMTDRRENNKEVTVSVKDSGSGIDPEIFPRLFTKFATKSQAGTGLGLFISKNIIESHGGMIWAENNYTDYDGKKGATFTFSIPLSRPEQDK
jgi:signal transduction histidine kinase